MTGRLRMIRVSVAASILLAWLAWPAIWEIAATGAMAPGL